MSTRVAVAVVASIVVTTLLRAQCDDQLPLFPNSKFEVGENPWNVTSADLDGDGDADLAAPNYFSQSVSVLFNQGSGLFTSHLQYRVNGVPVFVTSADLDGDGDADLVTSNIAADTVSVLLNQGNGSFAAHVQYGVGKQPHSVTIVDLDGDGDADLATANYAQNTYDSTDTVSVLRNQGDGSFATQVQYGVGDKPEAVTSADLDGDGDADLAVANGQTQSVSVLLNQGDGTFATQVQYDLGASPNSVTSADLDGDGDLDLATGDNHYLLSVLLNRGNGTFATYARYGFEYGRHCVTTADLDGDGDADLATADNDNYADYGDTVSVILNQGDGTFLVPAEYGIGDEPSSVTSADLDGDGDADLAVANNFVDDYYHYSGYLSVLRNQGDGTFARNVNYGLPYSAADVTSADLDGDGDIDLAVANFVGFTSYCEQRVSVLLNHGDGTFATQVPYEAGECVLSVTSADLDGDGDVDLATANFRADTVSVLLNQGDGTFATHLQYGVGDSPGSVVSADLDGDGDADLATANFWSDTLSVLLNQGNGTFAPQVQYGAGTELRAVTNADLDGDGDVDLVTANFRAGAVSVVLNQGNGTFAAYVQYDVNDGPQSVTSADLDGDGDPDLATADWYGQSRSVSVLLNQGDGTFAMHVQYGTGDSVSSVTSADFDGDGDADLAAARDGRCVSVLLNTCSGDASWSNYGSGWPGTYGVPTFTAATDPVLCTTEALNLANSFGADTTTVVFIGLVAVDRPTLYDGHLLVAPMIVLLLPLPGGGFTLSDTLPCGPDFRGVSLYLQALEVDPGASKGISFTPGIRLVLGL